MKKKIRNGSMLGLVILCLCACGRSSDIYLDEYVEDTHEVQSAETESVIQTESATEVPLREVEMCFVYICGAVVYPGVYTLPEGSRIFEVIEMAGGLTEDADCAYVNQAERITDGMMLRIYTIEETSHMIEEDIGKWQKEDTSGDERIDINTATVSDFMTLPGIGSAKAEAIVAYRMEHGRFSSIEDLMKVPGIKEGIFQQMKEHIKVNN